LGLYASGSHDGARIAWRRDVRQRTGGVKLERRTRRVSRGDRRARKLAVGLAWHAQLRGCGGDDRDPGAEGGGCLRDRSVRAVGAGAVGAAVLPGKAAECAAAGRLDGTGTAALLGGAANLAPWHVAGNRVAWAELQAGGGAGAAYILPYAGEVSGTAVVEAVGAFVCCVKYLARKRPEQWFKYNRYIH
jgi:hypothetical protein